MRNSNFRHEVSGKGQESRIIGEALSESDSSNSLSSIAFHAKLMRTGKSWHAGKFYIVIIYPKQTDAIAPGVPDNREFRHRVEELVKATFTTLLTGDHSRWSPVREGRYELLIPVELISLEESMYSVVGGRPFTREWTDWADRALSVIAQAEYRWAPKWDTDSLPSGDDLLELINDFIRLSGPSPWPAPLPVLVLDSTGRNYQRRKGGHLVRNRLPNQAQLRREADWVKAQAENIRKPVSISSDLLLTVAEMLSKAVLPEAMKGTVVLVVGCKAESSKPGSVAGKARIGGRGCVATTFDLQLKGAELEPEEQLARAIIHEVGHNFGLDHCQRRCVMNFSLSPVLTHSEKLKERLIKALRPSYTSRFFCDSCAKKLVMLWRSMHDS